MLVTRTTKGQKVKKGQLWYQKKKKNGQPTLRTETQDFGLEAEVTEQVTQTSGLCTHGSVSFPLLLFSSVTLDDTTLRYVKHEKVTTMTYLHILRQDS
jgi:hypothetical protein